MNVLLDTATWINGAKEPETLPARIVAILEDPENALFLSGISLLEASTLGRKGRVDYGMSFGEWLKRALTDDVEVLPISPRLVAIENELPTTFHGDPADRIIASTAITHDLTLVTPDRVIAFNRVCKTIRYKWPRSGSR